MSAAILPEARTLTRNVAAALDRATAADWLEGLDWYRVAAGEARALAADYGVSFEAAAGVIAALSPRTSWELNVSYARELFETGKAPTLGRNVDKARAIAAGASPDAVLGGDKVRSFYSNIVHPASDAVCIDRHAVDCAVGRQLSDRERGPYLSTSARYRAFADAYRAAARTATYPCTPAQCQAVAWVVERNAA
jgi:hypothetical protein